MKIHGFYATALRAQRRGKDNLAPAEDVHNKNPSLVALGKNYVGWYRYRRKSFLFKPVHVGLRRPIGVGDHPACPLGAVLVSILILTVACTCSLEGYSPKYEFTPNR